MTELWKTKQVVKSKDDEDKSAETTSASATSITYLTVKTVSTDAKAQAQTQTEEVWTKKFCGVKIRVSKEVLWLDHTQQRTHRLHWIGQ